MNIAVIGGGAAGLMSAVIARQNGADVTLYEKNDALGKKIAATGNGRCNFTNADADNVRHYYGSDSNAINAVLSHFGRDKILSFFENIGIVPVLEDEGKYFPLSGQAASISELLERKLKDLKVNIVTSAKITAISAEKDNVTISVDGETKAFDKVIVATGGLAFPDTGSDGDGYSFAEKLGHTVRKQFPVIVQLKTDGGFPKRFSGLRVTAGASLFVDGKFIERYVDDLLFFDYGVSGPCIFKESVKAAYALEEKKKVSLELDFVPSLDDDKTEKLLLSRCASSEHTAEEIFVGFIHKKLISLVLAKSGISEDKKAKDLSANDIKKLVSALKHYGVSVTGTKGYENAQATAGGIPLSEINTDTMQSKKNGRIYFAGEVLDVVGDCGGYNLTWAWASGYTAGKGVLL